MSKCSEEQEVVIQISKKVIFLKNTSLGHKLNLVLKYHKENVYNIKITKIY